VLFTSANSVEAVVARIGKAALDSSVFQRVLVGAVGRATEALLEENGIRVDLVPDEHSGDELARVLGRGSGRVLAPRAETAPEDAIDELRAVGWKVDAVPAYRTVAGPADTREARAVAAREFDAVTFASGSAARNFVEMAGAPGELGLGQGDEPRRAVVCIGPRTAEEATRAGLRVDAVAEDQTAAGLVDALRRHFGAPGGQRMGESDSGRGTIGR
jgi:uroporphyrinogen-III synthase